MKKFITIAIDGTAASGKTTTSLAISKKYGLMVVTTGMYYRALTLYMMRLNIGSCDNAGIEKLLKGINLGSVVTGNLSSMTINGTSFCDADMRTKEVNSHVAEYSSVLSIRDFLVPYQRNQVVVSQKNGFYGIVMEGRDITSTILPDADLKFFLEANERTRQERREKDGEDDCISSRDRIDNARTVCGSDVIRIDTGRNDLQQVIEIISKKIDAILEASELA